MTARAERAAEAARLYAEGLNGIEIAKRMQISRAYAYELLSDPAGEKTKVRKASYGAPCARCGAPTSGSEGRREVPRCRSCARSENARWTRETIGVAMRAWADEFGEPPSMNCWGMAATTLRDFERQALYAERNAAGLIPHAQRVIAVFGSWNAAVSAAGLTPRVSGGGGGNSDRLRSVRRRLAA